MSGRKGPVRTVEEIEEKIQSQSGMLSVVLSAVSVLMYFLFSRGISNYLLFLRDSLSSMVRVLSR